jgi:hypothetical protein
MKSLFLLLIVAIQLICYSQPADSNKVVYHFSGNVTATNNGISLIPSFSIGKPAVISLLSIGNERFSIDPDIRFTLEGKPWSIVFNARYKWIKTTRFLFSTGLSTAINFKATTFTSDNTANDYILARRFIGAEVNCNYAISNKNNVGVFYLYAKGIDFGTSKNNHFVSLTSNFSKLINFKNCFLNFKPQIYQVFQDKNTGNFANATLSLHKNNFPISISYILNKKIKSNLTGVDDTIWSLNLAYNFNQNFTIQTK